jgi:AP-1 complex subunit mu
MVCSAIFITDTKGKVIISRNYRGDIPMAVSEKFSLFIQEKDEYELRPVFTDEGITYVYIKCNNLLLLAVTKRNSNIALILFFLYKLTDVFRDYFGELEEESIRDNFVVVYELLDETMDFGYPQSCESKILREVVTQESNRLECAPRPPIALTNAVSWRTEGIKHRKNEIFLDVIEKLNLLVSSNGTVLHSEIIGSVQMKSFLSGMPELKLGLNDKLMFEATGRSATRIKSVELEDMKFHQCVRLARFENDRTISFIPPDGEFELMSYRLNTQVKPLIWVEAVVEPHSHSRIEYMVKAKSQFKSRSIANNVEIIIPVPSDVDSPSFKASIGTVVYFPDRNAVVWTIKQFTGSKEFLMRAHFGLPSITSEEGGVGEDQWKAPIEVKFEIPYFTVSGLQVRYLKIIEKSGYQALPWVRYITMNGNYQLRMS